MCFLPNVIGGKYPTQTVPITCPMWALCSAPQLLPAKESQPRGVALKWRCPQWAHREPSSRSPLSAGSRVQGKLPGLVLKDAKRYQRRGWVGRLQRDDVGGRKESTSTGLRNLASRPHWQARKLGADFHEFFWDKAFVFLTFSLYTVSLGKVIVTLPPSPWLQAPAGR